MWGAKPSWESAPVSDLAGLRGGEPDWGPSSLSLTSLQEVLGSGTPGAHGLDLCLVCVCGGGSSAGRRG